MAERRMLSKTISTSRKVNRLNERAALLFTWLIPHVDDFGRMEGDAPSVKAKVVPMRPVTDDEVDDDLKIMEGKLIDRYEIEGETYLEILNFDSFQTFRTDRKRRAEYPDKDGNYPIDPRQDTNDNQEDTNDAPKGGNGQRKRREEKGSKGKGREGKIESSISYLQKIPDADVKEFMDRFVVTEKQIRSKAEDLKLYCDRNGRVYKNYKSFLLNAIKTDFKERGDTPSGGKYKGL